MNLGLRLEEVGSRRVSAVVLAAFVLLSGGCQRPDALSSESTDLFLVEIESHDGLTQLSDARNFTNRDGYDNQPSYTLDGRAILYVARVGMNSDVYRYDLDTEENSRLTSAGDREYSPKMLPDGSRFSAIRAERDRRRRVWVYEPDGVHAKPLWVNVTDPILYYDWADSMTAAVVIEDRSGLWVLNIIDLESGVPAPLVEDVGRSVNRIPGRRAVSFVHKETVADWWITEIDLDSGEVRKLARTLQGSEDHAWTPDGAIVMAHESEVYIFVPGGDETWRSIANYARQGLRQISRVAVSPAGDSLVLVAETARN